MKRVLTGTFLVVLSWSVAWAIAPGNDVPEQLDKARKLIVPEISAQMSGWVHRMVTPMEGSRNVIIDQWESGKRIVRVSILLHGSRQEAVRELREFRSHIEIEDKVLKSKGKEGRLKEDLSDVGDSGFVWDTFGSEAIAFRKNGLSVYVSMINPEQDKDKKLSKEVAKIIAKALP